MAFTSSKATPPGTNTRTVATSLNALALVAALVSAGTAAAEWRFDPVVRAAYDFDDNARLSGRTDQEIDLSGYIVEGSLDMTYRSAQSFFSFRPMLRSRNYGSDSDENSDDQFVDFFGLFEGDRNTLRIFGDASREAVRTAERADAGLDTDEDPDIIDDNQAGLFFINQRRERFQIIPRWTYRFSNVSSFETEARYVSVDYDEPEGNVSLFGFDDARLSLRYRRSFSPRNVAIFEVSGRDFNSERAGGDSNTYGVSVGFVRSLSETIQLRALVGVESIDQEDVIGQESVSNEAQPVVDLTFIQDLETIRLLAQYRQRVNSSGQGVLTRRDEINLRFTRDLTETFSAGLGVRAYTDDIITGVAVEQDYVQLRGQISWQLSRTFSIQADYRHSIIDRDIVEGAADSNQFTFWLSYQPNPVRRDDRLRLRL